MKTQYFPSIAIADVTEDIASKISTALDILPKIWDLGMRAGALAHLGATLAAAGQLSASQGVFKLALATALKVKDRYEAARAFGTLAEGLAKAGQIAEALTALHGAKEARTRSIALSAVAKAQAKSGKKARAVKYFAQSWATARLIGSRRDRFRKQRFPRDLDNTVVTVARNQAEAGQDSDAIACARAIEQGDARARALGAIAEAQAKAGQFSAALSVAREIEGADARVRALRAIAEAQAKAGSTVEARKTFSEAISDVNSVAEMGPLIGHLIDIVIAQAAAGFVSDARETLSIAVAYASRRGGGVWNEDNLLILARLASGQAATGYRAEADETLQETLSHAKTMLSRSGQASTLRQIAMILAEAGQFAMSKRVAHSIESDFRYRDDYDGRYAADRAEALCFISEAEAGAGRIDDAFATFRDAENAASYLPPGHPYQGLLYRTLFFTFVNLAFFPTKATIAL